MHFKTWHILQIHQISTGYRYLKSFLARSKGFICDTWFIGRLKTFQFQFKSVVWKDKWSLTVFCNLDTYHNVSTSSLTQQANLPKLHALKTSFCQLNSSTSALSWPRWSAFVCSGLLKIRKHAFGDPAGLHLFIRYKFFNSSGILR